MWNKSYLANSQGKAENSSLMWIIPQAVVGRHLHLCLVYLWIFLNSIFCKRNARQVRILFARVRYTFIFLGSYFLLLFKVTFARFSNSNFLPIVKKGNKHIISNILTINHFNWIEDGTIVDHLMRLFYLRRFIFREYRGNFFYYHLI